MRPAICRSEATRPGGVLSTVNQRNGDARQTPLMLACEAGPGHAARAVSALLALGADPWLGDAAARFTCVHYAVGAGDVEAIRAVVEFVRSHPPAGHYRIPDDHPHDMWVGARHVWL